MRLPMETIALVTGQNIDPGSVYTFRDIFPLGGEGWHSLVLSFKDTMATYNAGTAIIRGGFKLRQNITLRTSKNEVLVSTPGMGLYYLNWILGRTQPTYDPIAAADGTYNTVIEIPLTHRLLSRKEDLTVDSGRYSAVELEIMNGTINNLLVGNDTATLATTVDITLVRNKSCFEKTGKPLALPYIKHLPPYSQSVKEYIDIESAEDLTLFGFILSCQDMDTPEANHCPLPGVPYSGLPVDWLNNVTFRDNVTAYLRLLQTEWFQMARAKMADIDRPDIDLPPAALIQDTLAGQYPYIFIQEGSIFNGYWTGQKSEIRLEHSYIVPDPDPTIEAQMDVLLFGMRKMRA